MQALFIANAIFEADSGQLNRPPGT